MGVLFVVGTSIGNLSDMTFRAVETLKTVDFICAEDTRVTAKLLNHFDIKKPMVSYHEHNARAAGKAVCERLLAGENAAIVTDAGMPCISDPGADLVRACAEKGIEVRVVPGASAVVSAVAVSGLDTSRFSFEGFLSVTKKQRFSHLFQVKDLPTTLVFYEAPHKLLNTLTDMLECFGDRRISLCRELTKVHEEVFRTTLLQAVEFYTENKPRGEFVLVIEGAKTAVETASEDDAIERVRTLVAGGLRPTEACKMVASDTGIPKGKLYSLLISNY